MKGPILVICIFCFSCLSKSKPNEDTLHGTQIDKDDSKGTLLDAHISKADSIVLIRHSDLDFRIINNDSVFKEDRPLILNGNLNPDIIEKRAKISSEIHELIRIFRRKANLDVSSATCFAPHHAIIFYLGKKISYIDLCFSCANFQTSQDINIGLEEFDQQRWKDLYSLFTSKGLQYEEIIR